MIFIQFSPQNITFKKNRNRFSASYQLEVFVYDQKNILNSKKIIIDSISVENYNSFKGDRLFRLPFHLPSGKYKLSLRISDLNSQKQYVLEKDFSVQSMKFGDCYLSEVCLAGKKNMSVEVKNYINEGIKAYPQAIYGMEQPELFYYFEICIRNELQINSKIYYTVYYQHQNGSTEYVEQEQIFLQNKYIPVMHSIDTNNLYPGEYELIIKLWSDEKELELIRKKKFYVYQSPIDLRFRSYDEVLDELSIFASKEKIKQLKNAPEHIKQNALIDFWKKMDPNPTTRRNELMEEYYCRLNYAKKCFSRRKSKSLTERGIIFTRYGKPTKIIRQQDMMKRIYFETWIYTDLSLQFVFQDAFGFGEYRLVHNYSDFY
jgi:GWxTD domain-containing protein